MKKLNKITGWLIPVLIILIYSALSNSYILIQKFNAILYQPAASGVYLTAALLALYLIFLWLTVAFIFLKKKKAKTAFLFTAVFGTIFSFWYYLVGQFIYYSYKAEFIITYNLPMVLVNLAITIAILLYFSKSKKLNQTLK
ncbi:hypothetical protein COV15_00560 [Candidatus Woesearchaeota archaeon CG10_big_fil_rev_8_21_14_0_10_34_12]|nr:MAG: hypothetical protein COV15_00560 [Candidatus Woesearchaeota archaeon CG10_big_fil_rev_8_21_14_0_10_34_12]